MNNIDKHVPGNGKHIMVLLLTHLSGLVIVPIIFAAIAWVITNADKIDRFIQKILLKLL